MNDIKNIIPTDLTEFTENAYLDYSMYVILDRALPRIQDGLKPVQRRILYAMSELHLQHTAKYKKSARTVGDVLGKYHPHGDSACYEAMVGMAQPFNYRYNLVDGQGNWGSQDDPKSFAAMRYTESRLTAYAGSMLSEIKSGTTDFVNNFDGTLQEPVFLPVQVPNVLLNTSTGIAVGMATDILPHNMREVIEATKLVLDNPKVTIDDVMQHIKAPDFPSGGEITNTKAEIKKIYETGQGSIKVRAKYHVENERDIVITELPYKAQGEKIIEKLADLMQKKKLSMVDNLRDESDHQNPIRIVIVLKKSNKLSVDAIMNHIFSVSDLEMSRKANFNMIGLDGKPEVKPLIKIMKEWIAFRQDTVKRKLNFRLDKIHSRLHLIEALVVTFLNLDEVIEIIRSQENPKSVLMERFSLSEIQANYILDTKLRNLAKIEENELNRERNDLEVEAELISSILASEKRLNTLIKKSMDKIVNDFGDERRSRLITPVLTDEITELDLAPSEPVTIMISKNGWIRSGKGHQINPETLSYKTGDSFLMSSKTDSNKESILLDDSGRSYTISNTDLPNAKSLGAPLSSMVQPASGAKFTSIFPSSSEGKKILASKQGYGFICDSEEFYTKQKKGKALLNCGFGNGLPVKEISDSDMVSVLTKLGYLLVFDISNLTELSKGKGNKLISLLPDDEVVSVDCFKLGDAVNVIGSSKAERWTQSKIEPFLGTRGRRGKMVPKTFGTMIEITKEN